MLQRRRIILAADIQHRNAGHGFVHAVCRPRRFIVVVIRLFIFPHRFQNEGIDIVHLAALHAFVEKRDALDCALGIVLGALEVIAAVGIFRHSDQRRDMVNVAPQRLFPIAVRLDGRITVLRHMHARKIQLLGAVHARGRRHVGDDIRHGIFVEMFFCIFPDGLAAAHRRHGHKRRQRLCFQCDAGVGRERADRLGEHPLPVLHGDRRVFKGLCRLHEDLAVFAVDPKRDVEVGKGGRADP